jgi:hypothetical protein
LIPGTLKLIRVALHKLRGMGFKEAVIVTDHGFFLNAQAEAGDVCVKPQGKWPVNAHDRMMLGDGSADGHSLVSARRRLAFEAISQVAYRAAWRRIAQAILYFHGGLPGGGRRAGAGRAPGYRAHAELRKVWWS